MNTNKAQDKATPKMDTYTKEGLIQACKTTLHNLIECGRIEGNKIVIEFNPKCDTEDIYDAWILQCGNAIQQAE